MSRDLPNDEAGVRACLATIDACIGALYDQRKQMVDHLWKVQEKEAVRRHYGDLVREAAAEARPDLPGLATP